MNKKPISILLAAVMVLQLTACGNGNTLGDSGSETLSKKEISVKEIDDSEYYVRAFEFYKAHWLIYRQYCTCPDEPCNLEEFIKESLYEFSEEDFYTQGELSAIESAEITSAENVSDNVNSEVSETPAQEDNILHIGTAIIQGVQTQIIDTDDYLIDENYIPQFGEGELIDDDGIKISVKEYKVDESYKDNAYYTQLDADYKKVYDDLYLWCDIIMRHKYDVVPATGNSYYVDYIYFTDEDFEDKKELAMEFIKANPQFFFIESLEYDTSGRLWLKMYDGYENGEARVAEAERRSE